MLNPTEKQIKRQIKLNAAKLLETPVEPTEAETDAHNALADETDRLEVELRRLISERI